jgi:hypothetical protein
MLTVTVRGTTPAGQVALWDTTQPAGEVFLVSGETAKVALTRAVSDALTRGFLAIVEEPPAPAPEPEIAHAEPSKPAKRGRP